MEQKKQEMKQLTEYKAMKTTGKRLFPAVVALFALLPSSCVQDERVESGSGIPENALYVSSVRFEADVADAQTQVDTRVAGDDVPVVLKTGSIGIFRTKGTGYTSALDNKRYTYSSVGSHWQPASTSDTIFLNGDDASVCAYYPYNSVYTDKTLIPLKSGKYIGTASVHDPADICYDIDRTMNPTRRSTTFEMKHAMALIEFSIVTSPGYKGDCRLTGISIADPAVITTSAINISAGTYSASPVKGTVSYNPGTDANGVLLDATAATNTGALLVPFTPTAAGLAVTFTVNGIAIKVPISTDLVKEVQPGHRYSVNITVWPSTLSVTGVDMLPWEESGVGGDDYTWYPKEEDKHPDGPIHIGSHLWAWSNLDYVDGKYALGDFQAWDATRTLWWPYCSLTANTSPDAQPKPGNSTYSYANDPCSRLEPVGEWEMPNKHQVNLLLKTPQAEDADGRWFGTAVAIDPKKDDGTYLYLPSNTFIPGGGAPVPGSAYWLSDGTPKEALKVLVGNAPDIVSLGSGSYNAHVRCVKIRRTIDIAGTQWAMGNLVRKAGGTYIIDSYQAERPLGLPEPDAPIVLNNWSGILHDYHFIWNGGDINLGAVSKSEKHYDPADDPCAKVAPANTWRTPTIDEYKAAAAVGKAEGTYTLYGKTVKGYWLGTNAQPAVGSEDEYLFLPTMGGGDNFTYYPSYTQYWTGTWSNSANGKVYDAATGKESALSKAFNFPVRCVKGTLTPLPPPYELTTSDEVKIGVATYARTNLNNDYTFESEPWISGKLNGDTDDDYWVFGARSASNTTYYQGTASWSTLTGAEEDPCKRASGGWILPTAKQLQDLTNYILPEEARVRVNGEVLWVQTKGKAANGTGNGVGRIAGTVFHDSKTGHTLFIPYAGISEGTQYVGDACSIHSSDGSKNSTLCSPLTMSGKVCEVGEPAFSYRYGGVSIRCVK